MTAAFFVDLPNFYSHLLESSIEEPRFLRDYFLYWLDFDVLAKALVHSFSGIWIFYSGRRFGPKENRVKDEYLDRYITRINSLRGVTARDVNIPGQQREISTYRCEECGHEGVSQWESEKGIDASLTVHLFDTMDSWDVAYLLSGDADFVPAVASLRRRGKIVIGAGFSNASAALVRECYDYVDLCDLFLRRDAAAYTVFRPGGVAERWLTDEVQCTSGSSFETMRFAIDWRAAQGFSGDESSYPDELLPQSYLRLSSEGPADLSSRTQCIKELENKFAHPLAYQIVIRKKDDKSWDLTILSPASESVERRINAFVASMMKDSKATRGVGTHLTAEYQYNPDSNGYELVIDQSPLTR